MILTDKNIRELCSNISENRLIEPFSEDSLQSESYDLAIGDKIAVMKKEIRCLNIYDQEDIDDIYEEQPLPLTGYILSPKEYVIVSMYEKITLPDYITAHIRPRTRFTRLGLLISDQHCNSTYSGYLKTGLFNATEYGIKIYPGVKIAQIVFEELKTKPSDEKLYKNKRNAIYQGEQSFIGAKFSDELNAKVNETINLLLKKDK